MQGEASMRLPFLVLPCVAVLAAPGAEKRPPTGLTSNENVELRAVAYLDKETIRQAVGADLDSGIVVVEVRVKPQPETKLKVNRDDFLLRSDKDGQKSQPFAPSQIAGSGYLVVSTRSSGGAGVMGEDRGPIWGGIGGPPRRAGGDGGAIGNTGESSAQASVAAGSKDVKENPLLAALASKILPEKETAEPLTGLLYFLLEGKHKPKDLELLYRGPAGRLSLRFRQ